jgi:hypothetical protein
VGRVHRAPRDLLAIDPFQTPVAVRSVPIMQGSEVREFPEQSRNSSQGIGLKVFESGP